MSQENPTIETGVDKLMEIVGAKKKVSLQEAAKELSVTPEVIQEWADFLEEEGLITIDYSIRTTYLEEKKLDEKDIKKKAKEFDNSKEAFVRKVENAKSQIDHSAQDLEKFKEQFHQLKEQMGSEFNTVKTELSELDKLHKMKNDIIKDIHQQQNDFHKKIEDMDKKLENERKRYKEILQQIEKEKNDLKNEKTKADDLKTKEMNLYGKLESLSEDIKKLSKTIEDEDKKVENTENHIGKLEDAAEKVRREVISGRENLDNVIAQNREHENK
ncbi:MAG: hypothetical protein ACOCZQ_03065, partial [Nanoarchaeota archaeon]